MKKWLLLLTTALLLAVLTLGIAVAETAPVKGTEDAFIANDGSAPQTDGFIEEMQKMIDEKGDIATWSLADKAQLGDLMDKYNIGQQGEARYVLSGDADGTEDEVVEKALAAIQERFSDEIDSVDTLRQSYGIEVFFSAYPADPDNPFWQVDLRVPIADGVANGTLAYSVTYKPRTDEITEVYRGDTDAWVRMTEMEEARKRQEEERGVRFDAWTVEQKAEFDREWYGENTPGICGIPGPDDVQEAEAVRIASEALTAQLGIDQAKIDSTLDIWRMFIVENPEEGTARWIITFVSKGEDPGPMDSFTEAYTVFMNGNTGEVGDVFDQKDGNG